MKKAAFVVIDLQNDITKHYKEIIGNVNVGMVHYAHPYSSWERGSNENQNKLVRHFVPKGTDMEGLTQEDVARIEYWMNHYPR